MVGISVDSAEKSTALTRRMKLRLPLLSDPSMKVISAYGVAMEGRDIAVPAVFIVGKGHKILYRYIGESMSDRPDPDELVSRAGSKP